MNNTADLINEIDIENLYQHVAALEGVKHPLNTPQELARAAAYLSASLHKAGVKMRLQPFKVDGFEDAFYNVEGWVGDESKPEIVLIAHYDTVWNDPGANDNAAGLAVILEIARILALLPDPPHVRFVAVSLEEGNPALEIQKRESLRRLGLIDKQMRFTTHQTSQLLRHLEDFILAAMWSGQTYQEGLVRFTNYYDEQLSDEIHTHLLDLDAIYGHFNGQSSIGVMNRIGSLIWLREALLSGRTVKYAVCPDEIGTISEEPGSQRYPANIQFTQIQTHRVKLEERIGNFVMAITEENSFALGQQFSSACKQPEIDLPLVWLPLPVKGKETAQQFPQAMGSDHAAFWLAGIPTLSLTDTAYLRNPYSHTMADTIDKINFKHVRKISQALLLMLLHDQNP